MTDASYCYRHPDRGTRLSCSNCGRPICVDCTIDTPVGQKCSECAQPEGRHKVITAQTLRRGVRRAAPVTFTLLFINLGLFVLGEVDPEIGRRLFVEGAQQVDLIRTGEWWRAVTSMFLHASPAHVGFNMWALYLFGPALERRYGSLPFSLLYLTAGLGGSALYHLVGRDNPAVGASGAIFGLMGALIVTLYRQRHTPMARAVLSQLMLLLAINLALPLVIANIAWEAHLGGLIAGAAVAIAWDRLPVTGREAVPRQLSVALAVMVVAVGALLFG
ncbi:MAG: rhomboid family intramembrane serine protease [Acidimicrobiia bacterium]